MFLTKPRPKTMYCFYIHIKALQHLYPNITKLNDDTFLVSVVLLLKTYGFILPSKKTSFLLSKSDANRVSLQYARHLIF